jgi:predicted Zn-dependent protease
VQLGSSLRNIGEHAEAVRVLSDACRAFPQHRALRAFLALALVSNGQSTDAVAELLDLLLTNPGPVEAYSRSLRYYADTLSSA